MAAASRNTTARAPIRPERLVLLNFDGFQIADAMIAIADNDYPEVVMFNGNPYVPVLTADGRPRKLVDEPLRYRRVVPYRLDVGA